MTSKVCFIKHPFILKLKCVDILIRVIIMSLNSEMNFILISNWIKSEEKRCTVQL